MNLTNRAAAAIAGLLLIAPLAACSSDPEPSSPQVEPAPPTAVEKSDEPEVSTRGHLVKKVGQPAGQTGPDGSENVVNFVVTGISVDPVCTSEGAVAAERGHFVRVDMDVETTPDLGEVPFMPAEVNWKWVDSNGVTANGEPSTLASFKCLPEVEKLPIQIGPGEKATGALIFDVPTAEGTLVFTHGSSSGWEWAVPGE